MKTELSDAIERNDLEKVVEIFNSGLYINIRDDFLDTPLIIASRWGSVSIVEFLIDNGAEVKATNRLGRTALDYALRGQHIEVIRLLLRFDA